MSVMVGGTGIIGQDMVCGFNNDKKYLKKLPAYGITLSNGVKDTVEKIDGKKTVVQRLGKVVFDGSDDEQWGYDDINNRFRCAVSIKAKLYDRRFPAYAEGYHFKSQQIHEDKLLFLFNWGLRLIELFVYNYAYKTVEKFKAYLSETPLEVYYELENPIYTQI